MAARLEERFGGNVPPLGGPVGGASVWHDGVLFAVSSERPPALSLDGGTASAMSPVPDSAYWFALDTVERGRLRSFRYVVDDEWTQPYDLAGYNPLSYELPDVRRGTMTDERTVPSRIYPEASTPYWLYVNHGVDEVRGAPVMVWHDGRRRLPPGDNLGGMRMQIVSDNLVQLGLIPPMVHVLVWPSSGGHELPTGFDTQDDDRVMRVLQYSTVSDRYGRHLVEEVLPDVERTVKLRADAYSRGSSGHSAGGHCAFKLAWLRPDQFSRALCASATFTAKAWDPEQGKDGAFIYAQQVRREPKRNIRVWLTAGANDIEEARGSWPLGNLELANALKLNGYDFHLSFG